MNIGKVAKVATNLAAQFEKKTLCKGINANVLRPKNPAGVVRRGLTKADQFLKAGAKIEMEVPTNQFLQQIPQAQRKAVQNLLGNPETVHLKAKHNSKGDFSILGFLAKKGDKTVGKGAMSVSHFGEKNAVLKWRMSAGKNGKNLRTNGFVDCAKSAAPEETSVNFGLKKNKFLIDAQSGKFGVAHTEVDAVKGLKTLSKPLETGNIFNKNLTRVGQSNIDIIKHCLNETIGKRY